MIQQPINLFIQTVIIEDDLDSQELLLNIIRRNFPNIQISGSATSISSSVQLLKTVQPDLVIMDVELTDGLSLEIFKEIKDAAFEIIFLTAHDNYYKAALDHYAFSYILKPFDPQDLINAIERCIRLRTKEKLKFLNFQQFIQPTNPKVLIAAGKESFSVLLENIILIKAEGNYTSFILKNDKPILASNGLKYYYNLLGPKGFFKANRSTLINISHISSIIKKEAIKMSNAQIIYVSIRNKSKLLELIETLKR